MNGVLPLDKPSGMTSAAVVRTVKRMLPRHTVVGHAGTLDPLAEGVLPLLCGTATRLQELLHEFPKTYRVTVVFGYQTDTFDRDGQVVAHTEHLPTAAAIRTTCRALTGKLRQIPPLYSAVKLRGKPLYRYARQGLALPVALPSLARPVHIFAFTPLALGEQNAVLRVVCSRGTYVRSLIGDLAQRLGSLATVTALVREESASLRREHSVALHTLNTQTLSRCLIPLARLPLPQLRIADTDSCARLCNGQILPCPTPLFTQTQSKFLLADKIGTVFGIGTQQHDNLHLIRRL